MIIAKHSHGGERYYELWSRDGSRLLGVHSSRVKAERQERAIQISKARRAGYRIPRP